MEGAGTSRHRQCRVTSATDSTSTVQPEPSRENNLQHGHSALQTATIQGYRQRPFRVTDSGHSALQTAAIQRYRQRPFRVTDSGHSALQTAAIQRYRQRPFNVTDSGHSALQTAAVQGYRQRPFSVTSASLVTKLHFAAIFLNGH